MLVALFFTVICMFVSAQSKCTGIVRMVSSQCGVTGKGGVCCEYNDYNNASSSISGTNDGRCEVLLKRQHKYF